MTTSHPTTRAPAALNTIIPPAPVVEAVAVGAEQGEDLALADAEVDALERGVAGGVGLREVGDRDDGRHPVPGVVRLALG